jgi:hypothetical protein
VLPHGPAKITIPQHGATVASTWLAPSQFSSVSVILFVSVVSAVSVVWTEGVAVRHRPRLRLRLCAARIGRAEARTGGDGTDELDAPDGQFGASPCGHRLTERPYGQC